MRNLFSFLSKPNKGLAIYLLAMFLGVFLIKVSVHLFGYEETSIAGLGFIIGKLLLIDLKKINEND